MKYKGQTHQHGSLSVSLSCSQMEQLLQNTTSHQWRKELIDFQAKSLGQESILIQRPSITEDGQAIQTIPVATNVVACNASVWQLEPLHRHSRSDAALKHQVYHRSALHTFNASGTAAPWQMRRIWASHHVGIWCKALVVNIFAKSSSAWWEAGPHWPFQLQNLDLSYCVPDDRGRTNYSPYKLCQVWVVTTKIILFASRLPSGNDYKQTTSKQVNLLDCHTMSSPQRCQH